MEKILKKSKFDLLAYKKMYANAKDKKEAVDWLFSNIDDKFSFWEILYDKLEDECKVEYLTNNLLKGFI